MLSDCNGRAHAHELNWIFLLHFDEALSSIFDKEKSTKLRKQSGLSF